MKRGERGRHTHYTSSSQTLLIKESVVSVCVYIHMCRERKEETTPSRESLLTV